MDKPNQLALKIVCDEARLSAGALAVRSDFPLSQRNQRRLLKKIKINEQSLNETHTSNDYWGTVKC